MNLFIGNGIILRQMDPRKRKKLSLTSAFFTFFIDNLCWSIVFPIFAPYFLDPENLLFHRTVPESTRALLLGFFLMAFSLGQFFGAPIVGEYGDRHGRKKALGISVFFTLIGLLLTAWSMGKNELIGLFIGRLITGVFASNASICLACVSDLSENDDAKVKNFGYFSLIAGLSFIVGAFLGGKLSDPTVDTFFSPNFPIWLASALTFLNLLFIVFGFEETAEIQTKQPFCLFDSFRNIQIALQTKKIKKIYGVYFLFLFSWTMLFQFTPVLTVDRFEFTSSDIGDLALFMGILWALGAGYLSKLLLRFFSSMRILEWSLFLFPAFSLLLILPKHLYGMLFWLGFCVVIGAIAWPLCNGVISNLAPRQMQGKIMGMSQSIQSLAMAVAPLIGGLAFKASLVLPFILGGAASLGAGILYFTLKDRAKVD